MAEPNPAVASPAQPVDDKRFIEVTRQYQEGELTLGEAAAQLGISRWDYAARLRERRIAPGRDPRTPEDLQRLEEIAQSLSGKPPAAPTDLGQG